MNRTPPKLPEEGTNTMKYPKPPDETDPLKGLFFHSLKDDGLTIEWQGKILAQVNKDYYLVQLFEWFVGEPSACKLVSFAFMLNWNFYPDNKSMRQAYTAYSQRQTPPERKDG